MKTMSIASAFVALMMLPAQAAERGFYASGMVGYSLQAEDVTPYGNNLAVDPTFPGNFDGGDGFVGTVGLGYRYDNFRIEARLGMRENDFDEGKLGSGGRSGESFTADGEIQSKTFTVEGFYDWHNSSPVTPYVKAGIGISHTKYSTRVGGDGVAGFFDGLDGTTDGFYDGYSDGSDNNFVWLMGIGASFDATENVSLFGEYQYISLGQAQTGQDDFTDGFELDNAASHEVSLGARYHF